MYTEPMTQTAYRQMPDMIRNLQPFRGNSLSAELLSPGDGYVTTGRLAGADLDTFLADSTRIVYLIRSYATPVAWVTSDGEAYTVAQSFSVTTSRQQNMIRRVLAS